MKVKVSITILIFLLLILCNNTYVFASDNSSNSITVNSDNNNSVNEISAEYPILQLDTPYGILVTQYENIDISGSVSNYSQLLINNIPIDVNASGQFTYTYNLSLEKNEITIEASNSLGNSTYYKLYVSRQAPDNTDTHDKYTIPLILFIITLCITIYSLFVTKNISNLKIRSAQVIKIVLKSCWPFFLCAFLLSYVIMLTVVKSGSMEPTLNVGDTVFYNRLAYYFEEPQRGDIVVFFSDEFNSYYGKRIIGIPGDTIKFSDGKIILNGQALDESEYITDSRTNSSREFTVPADCYFVLGDNRENSSDSRYWYNPYINKKQLAGKYITSINFSFQFDIFNKLQKKP